MFIQKDIIKNSGPTSEKGDYHKILFSTSYYNGYSLLRATSLLLKGVQKIQLAPEERMFLDEPLDEISLYEFFSSEHTDVSVEKFINRLIKVIERIHYYLDGSEESHFKYLSRRYSKVIKSINSILEVY